ncbi:hypothetical protein ACHQM5_002076 [Ranunculus cassubicifolius]
MKLRELKDDIEEKYGLRVNLSRCAMIKKICLGEVENILKEQYAKLRDYGYELLRSNPGSTVRISAEGDVFERFYVCFDALKRGWKSGCRPVIGLDGSFLKGYCKGELLTAVGRNSNNQMYPIAWAIASDGENKASWKWFLENLIDDLDIYDGNGVTIISDQQKGLVEMVKEILPKVEHRNCARHVYANYRKNHGGAKLKKYFWKACKTGNGEHHKNLMGKIRDLKEEAYDYLAKNEHYKHFSRAWFEHHSKCDAV